MDGPKQGTWRRKRGTPEEMVGEQPNGFPRLSLNVRKVSFLVLYCCRTVLTCWDCRSCSPDELGGRYLNWAMGKSDDRCSSHLSPLQPLGVERVHGAEIRAADVHRVAPSAAAVVIVPAAVPVAVAELAGDDGCDEV